MRVTHDYGIPQGVPPKMEFLTYESTATPGGLAGEFGRSAMNETIIAELRKSLAHFENENALLRAKNAEVLKAASEEGSRSHPVNSNKQIKDLEKQCRDLEFYIAELEDKLDRVPVQVPVAKPQGTKVITKTITDDSALKALEEEHKRAEALEMRIKDLEEDVHNWEHKHAELEKEHSEVRGRLEELTPENDELRTELAKNNKLLKESEDLLKETETKWEKSEADRDKLRDDLKVVEDREVKHLEIQKQLKHRAESAEQELAAVNKWWGDKKGPICCKKKDPEPWKKHM